MLKKNRVALVILLLIWLTIIVQQSGKIQNSPGRDSKEPAREFESEAGSKFIHGGSPGHCVIVKDDLKSF